MARSDPSHREPTSWPNPPEPFTGPLSFNPGHFGPLSMRVDRMLMAVGGHFLLLPPPDILTCMQMASVPATCTYDTGTRPVHRAGVLRREAPAGSEAPAGLDPVLQAGELVRCPPGPAIRGSIGPDRRGLRLPDPGPATQRAAPRRGWPRPVAQRPSIFTPGSGAACPREIDPPLP